MERFQYESIIDGLQNCVITLTLGVAANNPVQYFGIPCVRTKYLQVDEAGTGKLGAYTESEKHLFRFVTPCDAQNPQKWDTITDQDGLVWTIVGAMSGADPCCRQWIAYIDTPKGQGSRFNRGH